MRRWCHGGVGCGGTAGDGGGEWRRVR
ncbi:hypothetical protein Tco_0080935, partial [Tanacetum coccineum]